MLRIYLIYVFVLLISNPTLASIIQTAQSGNWTDHKTWIGGIQPNQFDSVIVNSDDTLFINSSFAQSSYMENRGVVFFKSPTNFIKCIETNFVNGKIDGSSLGTLHTEKITFSKNSILGKCNLKVSKSALIKDTLTLISKNGTKEFKNLTNYGKLFNSANEDLNLSGYLENNGKISFKQGKIVFQKPTYIKGTLSVKTLKLSETLIVLDSLTILEEVIGKGKLVNKGILQLGMMNSKFKIDSLNLKHPGNELHLIRNGYQALPKISFEQARRIVFSGGGLYALENSLTADIVEIKNNSSLEISKKCTLDSLLCLDNSKIITRNDFHLENINELFFSKSSTLKLNNNQNIKNSIQVGTLFIAPSINLELNKNDTLYIGGNYTGDGFINGNPSIEYNGSHRQTIKKRNYNTLIYNNLCKDSSIFYGNNTIKHLIVKRGKLKIGNLSIHACQIDSLGQLLIGGNKPNFTDTTKISGKLIIHSDDAHPQFDFITITPNGMFVNNSSADVTISKGIDNNGIFLGCLGTACNYRFLNNSVSFSGKDTIQIPRLECNMIYNNGIVSITKEIHVDSLFNLPKGTLLLSLDTQNISGVMNFSSVNNSVVFNKHGNQRIPKSFDVVHNLVFQNNGEKSISSNLQINGDLRIEKQAHLKTDSFQVFGNPNGTLFIDSLATLSIGHNYNSNAIEFPLFSKINCHDSSLVIYASKENQNISSQPNYGNLTIDDGAVDSCEKHISGDSLIIKGNLTLLESSVNLVVKNKTVDLNGDWNGPGNISLTSGKLFIGGNGNSTGKIQPGSSEIIYDGMGNQKIKIGNYHNITIDKLGNAITKANSGSLFVENNAWVKSGNLDFNSEKSIINNLIIDDSVSFSSKYQEKSFKNICVNSSGSFLLNYDEEINVTGNIHCNGDFVCSDGLVIFSDSVNKQSLTGLGRIELSQAVITKQSQPLEIWSDLTLNDTLFIQNGTLELNGKMQLKFSGYISGETSSTPIAGLGKISFNKVISEETHENIKGIGLTLISHTNMGNTLIEREFEAHDLENGESINRMYTIEPSSNLNLNVTMLFNYLDSELNGNQEDELFIFKSIDSGNNWNKQGGIVDKKNNSITLSGITSFSKWTAGSSSIDFLAVDFISFDAERRDDNTLLISWEVLTELETEAYQINYSFDGVNYDSLTICEATNSSHYEYNWSHAPYQTIYLELVEINANDSICFLDTIVVNQIIGKNPIAWVSDKKIFTNYFPSGTINLYDSRGRLIGQNKYDISHLPRGKYYIELINEIGRWTFDFLN